MKTRLWNYALLLTVVLLAACQSPAPSTQQTQEPAAAVQTEASAGEAEAYPAPGQTESVTAPLQSGAAMYPDSKSGDEVTWAQAQAMIQNSEVTKVFVAKSMQVTLTLKDGRSLTTTEPTQGSIQALLQICGEPCQGIEFESE